jgi:hypothetical protein
VRLLLVLDETEEGERILRADGNRDRVVDPAELVPREGDHWRLEIAAECIQDGRSRLLPRVLLFRCGKTGLLTVADGGHHRGEVRLGDSGPVGVVRMDANADGMLHDPADRIWIDLDGDGAWDPFRERFAYREILTLGGGRYHLSSDPFGESLAIEPLLGVGKVRLLTEVGRPGSLLSRISVTLVSRDGAAVRVDGASGEVEVSVGEYRPSLLELEMLDAGPAWTYVFSDGGGRPDPRWYEVRKGETVAIDPVGDLELVLTVKDEKEAYRPGEEVVLQPLLYTSGGLLINSCSRRVRFAGVGGEEATVALVPANGDPVEARSGFA